MSRIALFSEQPLPELTSNESITVRGTLKYDKNRMAASPRTPLGELTALP